MAKIIFFDLETVDFKLKTVCAKAGITIDESRLHDASYDIMLTRELYYRITNTKI
jgi:DNA polymerase-3 subunit epsilon